MPVLNYADHGEIFLDVWIIKIICNYNMPICRV